MSPLVRILLAFVTLLSGAARGGAPAAAMRVRVSTAPQSTGAAGTAQEAPLDVERLRLTADQALAAGDLDGAISASRGLVEASPADGMAHWSLGVAYHRAGRHAESFAALDQAVALLPEVAGVHQARGIALLELQRFREAAAAFEVVTRLTPRDAQSHYLLGLARSLQANTPDASTAAQGAFARALELDPKHAFANYHNGRMLVERGEPGEALVHLRRAVAAAPGLTAVYQTLGNALLQLGEVEEGRRHLETFARLEGVDRELAMLGRLIPLRPTEVDLRLRRARLQVERGTPRQAIEDLNLAQKLAPELPEVWQLTAEVLAALGEPDAAREAQARAESLTPPEGR